MTDILLGLVIILGGVAGFFLVKKLTDPNSTWLEPVVDEAVEPEVDPKSKKQKTEE